MTCYRCLSCLASRAFWRTTHWHFLGYFQRPSQGHLWYKHHNIVSLITDYLQAQQGEMHCVLGQVLWINILLTHLHSTFTPSNCHFASCVFSIYFTGIKWVFLFFSFFVTGDSLVGGWNSYMLFQFVTLFWLMMPQQVVRFISHPFSKLQNQVIHCEF